MVHSFFVFLRRFILQNLLVASLKSVGLLLGMLGFILVYLIYDFHHSYDDWNPNKDQIYKVSFESPGGDYMGSDKYGVTSAVLAASINQTIPQVEYALRIDEVDELLLKIDEEPFLVEQVGALDPLGIDLIGIEFITGNKEVFTNPYSMIISESAASLLFGDKDPLGQVVYPEAYRKMSPYTIVGVYKDIPQNSVFNYDYIIGFEDYLKDTNPNSLEQWGNRSYYTFLSIPDEDNLTLIEDSATKIRNENLEDYDEDDESGFRYFLQPLTDLHFSEGINFEMGEPVDSENLDALLYIGLMILLISAFNAINLSIVETFQRQLEMGVRKTFGASRSQIVFQYLFETVLLMTALAVATVLCLYLLLPILNNFLNFELAPFSNPGFVPLLILMIIFLAGVTSAYPALILSRFHPGKNLKANVKSSTKLFGIRNVLVTFQFFLAGTLIVVSIGIYQQINFLLDTDPGYQRDGIMVVRIKDRDIRSSDEIRRTIKLQALQHPQVNMVAYSSQLPNRITSQNGRRWTTDSGEEHHISLYTLLVEPEIMNIYDIEMLEGRSFDEIFENNNGKYILNETAVEEIGIEDILGKRFTENSDTIEIVGIMKDFHGLSMHQPIRPIRFSVENISWWQYCSIRFDGDPKVVESHVTGLFNEYSDYPISTELFYDNYEQLYEEERNTRTRVALFTGLAILISCLGLFGLLLNSFESRQLELGIRKTLGAELNQLGWTLSRKLLIPIGLAWIVAMPVAFYFLKNWLTNFSYRISPGADSFLIATFFLVLAVTVTLIYMIVKIGRLNIVGILKSD